jgi:hypothetical protein
MFLNPELRITESGLAAMHGSYIRSIQTTSIPQRAAWGPIATGYPSLGNYVDNYAQTRTIIALLKEGEYRRWHRLGAIFSSKDLQAHAH